MGGWFLKNWFPLGLSASVTALLAFGLHTLSVSWLEASHGREMAKQKTVLTEQCEAAKAVTEEVSNELQKQIALRDASIADARRMLNKRCASPVVVNSPSGHDGSSQAGKHGGSDDRALVADGNFLIDFAEEAEGYRIRLSACQSFVERSRAARLNQ